MRRFVRREGVGIGRCIFSAQRDSGRRTYSGYKSPRAQTKQVKKGTDNIFFARVLWQSPALSTYLPIFYIHSLPVHTSGFATRFANPQKSVDRTLKSGLKRYQEIQTFILPYPDITNIPSMFYNKKH